MTAVTSPVAAWEVLSPSKHWTYRDSRAETRALARETLCSSQLQQAVRAEISPWWRASEWKREKSSERVEQESAADKDTRDSELRLRSPLDRRGCFEAETPRTVAPLFYKLLWRCYMYLFLRVASVRNDPCVLSALS